MHSAMTPAFKDVVEEDLAKGVLGALTSTNNKGEGFGHAFLNSEFGVVGEQLVGEFNRDNNPWLTAVYGSVEKSLAGGLKSKLGGTAVSAGARTALYTSVVSYGIDGIESSFPGYYKYNFHGSSGAVNKGYALVQPKTKTSTNKNPHVTTTTTTIPLNSINGGTWLKGAPWAQL